MFKVAGGSVAGFHHERNQDALGWVESGGRLCGVVCDGCGEKSGSHVGSKLACELLLQCFLNQTECGHAKLLWKIEDEFLYRLRSLVEALSGAFRNFDSAVEEYFLFTVVGILADQRDVSVFSFGDGVYSFNRAPLVSLGPFPNNQPPYIGYRLYSTNPSQDRLSIRESRRTKKVNFVLIGTDGALALPQKGQEILTNPNLSRPCEIERVLHKLNATKLRLNVQAADHEVKVTPFREEGILDDDTSLLIVQKEAPAAPAPPRIPQKAAAQVQALVTGSRSTPHQKGGEGDGGFID